MTEDSAPSRRVRELVDALALVPHPEGGHYREFHRSRAHVTPHDGRPTRVALTTIHFLLAAGEASRWHRVASDEAWHHYEGDALELFVASPDGREVRRLVLGPALRDDGPVAVVPADHWQAARPLGAYALAGCTVAPGFEFDDFEFLRDEPTVAARLTALDPALAALL